MSDSLIRRGAAECIGTFGLVFIAAGAAMVDEISGGSLGLVGNAFASGLIVAAMIYAVGHISGAHINPAVTLAFALVRRISLRDVMGGHAITIDPVQAVGVEIVLTFLLMFVIMAVATDKRAVGRAAALAIGATVMFDILVGGPLTGGSMNPARTTGPALLAVNWQDLWVYWVGPPVGERRWPHSSICG